MPAYIRPWLTVLFGWVRGRRDLVLENAALRQQLAMYRRRRRPEVRDSDRSFWLLLARLWPGWRSVLVAVRPETVVRWHRAGWRRYWSWRSRPRRRGRPRIDREARELIMRLARENPRWGAVRIQGELRALGHEVSAETVRRYRLRALRRPPSGSWRAFLRNHRHHIWATDSFTVPTIALATLYVFERHLRAVLVKYVDYYNATRPHRTLPLACQRASAASMRGLPLARLLSSERWTGWRERT